MNCDTVVAVFTQYNKKIAALVKYAGIKIQEDMVFIVYLIWIQYVSLCPISIFSNANFLAYFC